MDVPWCSHAGIRTWTGDSQSCWACRYWRLLRATARVLFRSISVDTSYPSFHVSHMYLKSAISISWNLHIFSQKARFWSLAFLKASSLLHHRWTVFFHVECPAYLQVPMSFINNFHLEWTRITYIFWWQINNWPNESKKYSETLPTSLPSRVLMAKGMLNCFTPPYVDGANRTNVYIYISVHQKHRHSTEEVYLEACI